MYGNDAGRALSMA